MDKLVYRAVLFDNYGDLLNEKQRKIMEYTVYEDMSLSEIGEAEGISRQAASVLLKRGDERMQEFEGSLHMVEMKENIGEALKRLKGMKLDEGVKKELELIEKEINR